MGLWLVVGRFWVVLGLWFAFRCFPMFLGGCGEVVGGCGEFPNVVGLLWRGSGFLRCVVGCFGLFV